MSNTRSNAPSSARPMLGANHATNATDATDETRPRPRKTPLVPDAPTPVDNFNPRLFHYTCQHGFGKISNSMRLRPGTDGLVWLTDLDAPVRSALGLTSHILDCDRTEHRFEVVDTGRCIRWLDIRKWLPRAYVDALELAPGAMPAHWWIFDQPLEVTA